MTIVINNQYPQGLGEEEVDVGESLHHNQSRSSLEKKLQLPRYKQLQGHPHYLLLEPVWRDGWSSFITTDQGPVWGDGWSPFVITRCGSAWGQNWGRSLVWDWELHLWIIFDWESPCNRCITRLMQQIIGKQSDEASNFSRMFFAWYVQCLLHH